MEQSFDRSVVWIRRDLRIVDNAALSAACQQSKNVAVVFVFDSEILKYLKDKSDRRITFIHDSIKEVDEELQKRGSRLIVLIGNPINEIPKLVKELDFKAVFYNEDYEPYAKMRDLKVLDKLEKEDIPCFAHKDHVVFSGDEVLKPDSNPYRVFTPYKKTWLKTLKSGDIKEKTFENQYIAKKEILKVCKPYSLKDLGFERASFHYDFQKPGRKNALKHLNNFSDAMKGYAEDRDFPSEHGTSGLSVHLRFGTISIRECVRLSRESKSKGNQTWLSELIWRDFYHMILAQFPHVKDQAFKEKYDKIRWQGSDKNFKKWCDGETGYPIVDAAMKQLNNTGWMHNRLRMIVASFLTKDLLVDWRKGERYFAEKLLDYDMAANNGGWQWAASTGCDAQPYFRIFNPELQSKRYDPEGKFLKEWLPELSNCSKKQIHKPEDVETYPAPIVDHKEQKELALKMFKIL